MNFKISFKTWLKFARKRIRDNERKRVRAAQSGGNEAGGGHVPDARPKMIPVDIEVEHIYSATSEEESQVDRASGPSFSRKRSPTGLSSAYLGSVADLDQSIASPGK